MLLNIPFVVVFWVANLLSKAYHRTTGTDFLRKLGFVFGNLGVVFSRPLPSFFWKDLLVGLVVAGALKLYIYTKSKNAKQYRDGEEHGSARFGTAVDIKPYIDHKHFDNNILLSDTERLTMGKPSAPKFARNKNVLVVGGSGSGKTRFMVKPNLMQIYGSYILTDPKGTVLLECGTMLERHKYEIKVVNTINFSKSMHYNPFAYLHSEKDVLMLVNTLVANTKGEGDKSGEDFWVKAEKMLLTALIAYIYSEAPEEERNFSTLLEMINAMEVREEEESFQNAVDLLFSALEEREPDHIAVRQYKVFGQAAGKTAKSILVSAAVRLAAFTLPELIGITSRDELELDKMGERKQALFCVIPDNDNTFNYLIGMMYTQIYQALYYQADYVHHGPLPIPVRIIADEFANVAVPEDFEQIQSTMRSRAIHISIIIQDLNQIKKLFEKSWQTVVSNCDTLIYLGSNEPETHKYLSEMLGKETIDITTRGRTRGQSGSSSENYQTIARELMTPDEIRRMDNDYSIVIIRGEYPLWDKKYNLWKHPRLKEIDIGGAPMYLLPEIRYQLPDLPTERNLDEIIFEPVEVPYEKK